MFLKEFLAFQVRAFESFVTKKFFEHFLLLEHTKKRTRALSQEQNQLILLGNCIFYNKIKYVKQTRTGENLTSCITFQSDERIQSM